MRIMAFSSSNRNSARARASLGFADAGRAEENERADGPIRVLQTAAGAAHGVGHGVDGFVLADDALLQPLLHFDQFFPFAFQHAGDGNAGPGGDDLGDVFLRDFLVEQALALALGRIPFPAAASLRLQFREAAVLDLRGQVQVAGTLGGFLLSAGLLELAVENGDGVDGGLFILPLRFELRWPVP